MFRLAAIWRASASAAYPPPACSAASARSYFRIALSRRSGVVGPHLVLGLPQLAHRVVEAAGGQDPVQREHLGVAGARVLREVADLAGRACTVPARAAPRRRGSG